MTRWPAPLRITCRPDEPGVAAKPPDPEPMGEDRERQDGEQRHAGLAPAEAQRGADVGQPVGHKMSVTSVTSL